MQYTTITENIIRQIVEDVLCQLDLWGNPVEIQKKRRPRKIKPKPTELETELKKATAKYKKDEQWYENWKNRGIKQASMFNDFE